MNAEVLNFIDVVVNSSLLVTVVSFFIYLLKRKNERITEERTDILRDVQSLIFGIKKITYNEKTELLGFMDTVQMVFGTRNKLIYESLDREYIFGSLDKMISAKSEKEYMIHKEIVISFLYYFYENAKESFEEERNFKKRKMLFGVCIPLVSTTLFMILFGGIFSVKNIYVLFGYGFVFFMINVCIIMMGYCFVDDVYDKKKRVVDDKKAKKGLRFFLDIVPLLLFFSIEILLVVFCALMCGQENEPYFLIKLLMCFIFIAVYLLISVGYLCSIYNYKVQYIYGFETVTSRIFFERRYDTDQLRELAKKIVGESNDESIYIKLFVSVCDKHSWALYSEKRKLEKVMSSFEDAERLEKVIECIKATKKLKHELIELKKLYRAYRKRYEKLDVKLEEKRRLFLEQIEKCNVE